jgi:phosphocarrier protein HPr
MDSSKPIMNFTCDQIRGLANTMISLKRDGNRFNLIIGNGCSMECGIPSFSEIKAKLVRDYGIGNPDHEDAFDNLWDNASPLQRKSWLRGWMEDANISPGYMALSELIARGYFHIVINFNVDNILELALISIGYYKLITIINGITQQQPIRRLLNSHDNNVNLVKVHGDYRYGSMYLSSSEVLQFVEPYKDEINRISGSNLIVIGYSFDDLDWLKSLSINGESIYYVNPSNPNLRIKSILRARNSTNNCIPLNFSQFSTLLLEKIKELTPTPNQIVLKKFLITSPQGLHARTLTDIVSGISKCSSEIFITNGYLRVNGKSVMGMLTLGATKGDTITMEVIGPNAEADVVTISRVFSDVSTAS